MRWIVKAQEGLADRKVHVDSAQANTARSLLTHQNIGFHPVLHIWPRQNSSILFIPGVCHICGQDPAAAALLSASKGWR